jgi:hypothetical protein
MDFVPYIPNAPRKRGRRWTSNQQAAQADAPLESVDLPALFATPMDIDPTPPINNPPALPETIAELLPIHPPTLSPSQTPHLLHGTVPVPISQVDSPIIQLHSSNPDVPEINPQESLNGFGDDGEEDEFSGVGEGWEEAVNDEDLSPELHHQVLPSVNPHQVMFRLHLIITRLGGLNVMMVLLSHEFTPNMTHSGFQHHLQFFVLGNKVIC